MRMALVAGLMALLGAKLATGARHAPSEAEQGVEAQFRVERRAVSLHRPFAMVFSVRNESAGPVTLNLGPDFVGAFVFELTEPDGRRLRVAPRPIGPGPAVVYVEGRTTVQPGAVYEKRLILNRWLSFESVGTYFLRVSIPNGLGLPDGTTLSPRSAMLRLEVGPRDAAKLARFCAGLLSEAESRSNGASAREVELELSQVNDPVAVPYLARALAIPNHLEGAAIAGLERIGSESAVDALISALSEKRGDTRALAGQALERLGSRTPDPVLRGRIRRALEKAGYR